MFSFLKGGTYQQVEISTLSGGGTQTLSIGVDLLVPYAHYAVRAILECPRLAWKKGVLPECGPAFECE